MKSVVTGAITLTVAACASAVTPEVSPNLQQAAQTIHADPVMQKMLEELMSEAAQKWRFVNQMEVTRIASPSRFELRRQAELTRRLIEEWGFSPADIMTRPDGLLKGAGLQTVDGLPVYNVCVRIPGSYARRNDAVRYRGEGPKVLMEGHIDTVNPPNLPPAATPYVPIKLQSVTEPVVKTPEELAALAESLHFTSNGKLIEDEAFKKAYQRYASPEEARAKGAVRLYLPGYNDAMINTIAVMQAAVMLKKYGIQPVYDLWVCGTAGEEGKGNLAGMKQLYGYSQDTGKGNNALNFVANFGVDSTRPGSGIVNYLGSYRFEIAYSEPAGFKLGDKARPSALSAMSRAVAKIADIHSPWDTDKTAERTTYTVGTVRCKEAPQAGRSQTCTLAVDMRSPTQGPLSAMREQIEPLFQKALDEENARYGVSAKDADAVTMKLVWFGDRPAYRRANYNDIAMQAWWQSAQTAGIDQVDKISEGAASLNDNVPAAVGVPTVNFNVGTNAGGGGGHTFYEWGIPGDGVAEGRRIYRLILASLLAAGYHTSTGAVVAPGVEPMGNRTTDERYH